MVHWYVLRRFRIKFGMTAKIIMNIESIKSQFPIFKQQTPLGKELIFLDTAASAQKPQTVIDAISSFYSGYYANTGRGSYWPANAATNSFEKAREKVAQFIHAQYPEEIVFTSGTTDAINKLAKAHFEHLLRPGDQLIVSEMEHHANLIPWQELAKRTGAQIKALPVDQEGQVSLSDLSALLAQRTVLVAITATSNVLGSKLDVAQISKRAHQEGAQVFVDAAQAIAHAKTDVQHWDCDFMAFSAHKLYGPTGFGVLYGKREWLDQMEPLSYGGGMITRVGITSAKYLRKSPHKHEAGTQHIAGAIGLGAAIDFVQEIGINEIEAYLDGLTQYALAKLKNIDLLDVKGGMERAPVIAFTVEGIHPHDLATFLNEKGISVRAGHHCAQPLMTKLNVHATTRASFGIYNTKADVDALTDAIEEAKAFFL